jgi:hypothetical protein
MGTSNPVVRLLWNTFTVPFGISDELANLIWLLVGVAEADAEALGLADGVAEALGLTDGDGFGLALFTGTGTPLPQTNLPLFLTQVNF